MINWQVKLEGKIHQENNWYFEDFPVQDYLIPMLNVGGPIIDEYADTNYQNEDLQRLIYNINYLLDSGFITNRSSIQFDHYGNDIVRIDTAVIIKNLEALKKAAEYALNKNGVLQLLGD